MDLWEVRWFVSSVDAIKTLRRLCAPLFRVVLRDNFLPGKNFLNNWRLKMYSFLSALIIYVQRVYVGGLFYFYVLFYVLILLDLLDLLVSTSGKWLRIDYWPYPKLGRISNLITRDNSPNFNCYRHNEAVLWYRLLGVQKDLFCVTNSLYRCSLQFLSLLKAKIL